MSKPTINLKKLSHHVRQKLSGALTDENEMALREAAGQIGIGAATLCRIVNGEHMPSLKTLVKLCEWLQTAATEFLTKHSEASGLLGLRYFSRPVNAGLPAPAFDDAADWLEMNPHLTRHPAQSFCVKVNGHSMIEAGINNYDLLIVDGAEEPLHGHIVVVSINNEFLVKRLDNSGQALIFRSANSKHPDQYPDITPKAGDEIRIWGRVVHSLRPH